ncbi:unnamed protein product [Pylaiella littoralis]
MDSATDCFLRCCSAVWILVLTLADILSDFLYFEELYSENKVPDGVAFAVLAFALIGLVTFMVGLNSQFATLGIAVSILFEDIPIIVATTAIQAYLVGVDVREWHPVAIVSYVFSLFAMQQKTVKLGLAGDMHDILNNRVADRELEVGPCFWWVVVLRSIAAVALAVAFSWAVSLFIILFAPDPPGQ